MTRPTPIIPAKECPRWDSCSVNRCPLDPGYHLLKSLPDDPTPKCTMERRVRERIGVKYSDILPWKGLTGHEIAASEREARMSEAQKEARKAKLSSVKEKLALWRARTLLEAVRPQRLDKKAKTHQETGKEHTLPEDHQ